MKTHHPPPQTNYVSCNDPSMEIIGTEFVEIGDMLWVVFEYATVSQTGESDTQLICDS